MPNAPAPAKPTGNAIHQGANEMIQAAGATTPGPNPTSDGQARGTAPSGRSAQIDYLIGQYSQWTESDRTWLSSLDDATWGKVTAHVKWGATTEIQPYSYDGIRDRSNVHSQNQQGMTLQQYLSTIPPQFREVVMNAVQELEGTKESLVQAILANVHNPFSRDFLMLKSVQELRGMAALAGGHRPTANYAGQADVPMFLTPLTNNANQQSGETPPVLPIPVWDFNKKTG